VRLIPFDSLTPAPWKNGGGVTRQVACSPSGSGLGDFDWRLSMAVVEQDGPFSCFPGVDRRLYILAGAGLDLRLAGGTQRLRQGEHLDFAGEAEVFGALIDGPVTDFNIMVRRGRSRMRAETLRIDGPQEIDHGWGTAALFVLGGELAVIDGAARRFDTVLLDDARPLSVSGSAEVLLIGLEALA
jgi:environmental stress-induced protein Ves